MNLEEAKKIIENIDKQFEDGFIDYYLDFLTSTIKACDSVLEMLVVLTITDKEKAKQEEEAERVQKLKMDALELIYEIYSDQIFLIKEQ